VTNVHPSVDRCAFLAPACDLSHLASIVDIFQIVKYETKVLLKPLDVVVSVKAAVMEGPWTIAQMAASLGMDNAQVFRAAKNAAAAQLLIADPKATKAAYRPHRAALLELLVHGIKYMAVPARGSLTRGMPTAHGAPPMAGRISADAEAIPVWPTPEGRIRGESFSPLHRCVPGAAARDPRFYQAMALVDAIRGGRARERTMGAALLEEVIGANRQ
jgi:hypothetical protein